MCSAAGDTTQLVPGSPIRTPWDHSSVDSSPRPIAASHVLHRLLVPRHPPCALSNLTTKMLASTVQFSTNATQPTHNTTAAHPKPRDAVLQPGQRPSSRPKNPTTSSSLSHHQPWLFFQDPTGCPTPPPAAPTRCLHTPRDKPHEQYSNDGPLPAMTSPVSPPSSTPPPQHNTGGCRAPGPRSRPGAH